MDASESIAVPEADDIDDSATENVAHDSVPTGKSKSALRRFWSEDLNFLLTNRIPRRSATLFMNWFSRIELAPVRAISIAGFKFFTPDLDLSEARETRFKSLNDCFVRKLKDGARPIEAGKDVLISPCDAIVGASGRVRGTRLFQAKGFPYVLEDLLPDPELVRRHRDGLYATLRLKGSMYHRFHAPCDGRLDEVHYVSGDTWNVNPIALQRVERLFCKNERAVLPIHTTFPGLQLTLVPVAAVLVATIRLKCLPDVLDLRRRGPNRLACETTFKKGDELGWFEQGSTILVFASGDVEFSSGVVPGQRIRMGAPLLRVRTARSNPDPSTGGDVSRS